MRGNRRLAVVGVGVLLLLLLAAALLGGKGHRGPVAAQSPGGVISSGPASAPTPSGVGHPSPTPSGTRPSATGSSPTPSTPAPTPAAPPTPPPYVFNPQPSASGSSPATHFLAGDLTLPAGQQLVATFSVSLPGSVTLHAFPEGSSSYPVGSLLACLEFTGQAACSPASFPNPAYWTVSASDLAQHQSYRLRVVGTVSPGGQLVGMDFGWNTAHHISLAGLDLPGGCSGPTGGYTAGCGIRFKLTAAFAGNLAVAVTTEVELHLKVQDKSTGTVACDLKFVGSSPPCGLYATLWTGHLYPETGQPVPSTSLSLNWP